MRRRKLVGADLDWFIIPIRKIATWGILIVVVAAGSVLGYRAYLKARPSAEDRARTEIESASELLNKATKIAGTVRPGSNVARARGFLQDAHNSMGDSRFEEAFRLAVESESYSRRVIGGWGADENGDASFIFVEGDVAMQRAGRSTFESARQRQPLFDGDFIRTGRNGSAEIMFTDGTLFTIRPGSLFEVRRPSASESDPVKSRVTSSAMAYTPKTSVSVIAEKCHLAA